MEANSCPQKLTIDQDLRNLSDGLLEIYQEPLEKVSTSLRELTTKQKSLIETVESQNLKLQTTQNSEIIKNMFADVSHCRERLVSIKKQMTSLHEKSSKLRVRSQNVLTKAMCRHTARILELDREQRLIGGQGSQQATSPT